MTDVLTTLAKLPPMCAARDLVTNKPILIQRGVLGYWPAPESLDIDAINARWNITPAQVKAMLAGSMFGWDAPLADPDNEWNQS